LLSAAVAVSAILGLGLIFALSERPTSRVVHSSGGLAAGDGITVGGNVNIGNGIKGASPKDPEQP
jgi:hypothetical protein